MRTAPPQASGKTQDTGGKSEFTRSELFNTAKEKPATTEAPKPPVADKAPTPTEAVPSTPMADTGEKRFAEKNDLKKESALPSQVADATKPDEASALQTVKSTPSYRIVGEVFHSYVIVEVEDKMLLIDKHAAHERILFEQLKAGLAQVEAVSQLLMLPIDVMMTSAEVEALKEYTEELEKIGFSLRYARNTVSADAIPESVDPNAVPDMLGGMAGRILNATGSVKLTRDIVFEKALYQAACKAAIKAGRAYADEHIKWIVDKLMAIPDITFCPHGRPVALELTHHMLDKQFDRTGF